MYFLHLTCMQRFVCQIAMPARYTVIEMCLYVRWLWLMLSCIMHNIRTIRRGGNQKPPHLSIVRHSCSMSFCACFKIAGARSKQFKEINLRRLIHTGNMLIIGCIEFFKKLFSCDLDNPDKNIFGLKVLFVQRMCFQKLQV